MTKRDVPLFDRVVSSTLQQILPCAISHSVRHDFRDVNVPVRVFRRWTLHDLSACDRNTVLSCRSDESIEDGLNRCRVLAGALSASSVLKAKTPETLSQLWSLVGWGTNGFQRLFLLDVGAHS